MKSDSILYDVSHAQQFSSPYDHIYNAASERIRADGGS